MRGEKCSECLGRSPYHAPSCRQNTEAERAQAEAEYRCWYGDDRDDDESDEICNCPDFEDVLTTDPCQRCGARL